ncbi:hypothetical protein HYX17_04920 [Candidatus Woesearchaeota archaeon]|nr:hypothetical protein [Candidatus Woesearchaeota archaeon]
MELGIVILKQEFEQDSYFYLPTAYKWVYEFYEKHVKEFSIEFLGGRYGISDEELDEFMKRAERIVSKHNRDGTELTNEDLEYILENSTVD